ncbi:nitrate reductase molybdenum cofactor assembly chaperone [Rhodopila sp.]|jgi:nitrate reductase delta subunit|uniref:nitrate reductase molybdenum cofactor assembly chaperone n=1 Tax=Rhodopila sp. TaxID=2480087 RepID=UPI002BD5A375|nr:nitrate reductase molybdenum cofactor assembly chaperone [Rhodopila sp.]HVZ06790.1 nitrate reductase molybdenum cofactor assembly chaperone [Rhodopila sp.]
MAATFKALSALLTYPTEELQRAAGEIRTAIETEGLVDRHARAALAPFLDELAAADLFDLQERYVDLFDKSRRLSLHLFEHVHGESRDRGQAMVDLAALYERGGLVLSANELPDFLPLFLEYLSTRPLQEARGVLSDTLHILSALQARLAERGSPYAAVLGAIRAAAGDRKTASDAEPAQPDDLAALDAAWEETAVVFGPGDATDGCSVDRLRIRMRAGQRDVRQAAV